MIPHLQITPLEQKRQRRVALIKAVLLASMFLLFYLLADSMVNHRFFRGGWMNHNNYPHSDQQDEEP